MTENITIKQATLNDIDDIAQLLTAYRDYHGEAQKDIQSIINFVSDRIKHNEVMLFLAYCRDKAIGVAQLYPLYSTLSLRKVWILYDLFVDETYRGMGVGKALLERCKNFAISDGACRLELKTDYDNHAARNLYEHFGFLEDNHIYYKLKLEAK